MLTEWFYIKSHCSAQNGTVLKQNTRFQLLTESKVIDNNAPFQANAYRRYLRNKNEAE